MTYIFINSENDVIVVSAKGDLEANLKLRNIIEEEIIAIRTTDLDNQIAEKFNDYILKGIRATWYEKLQNLFKW